MSIVYGPHEFSPRKRRCFYLACLVYCIGIVFSAQAEVFLAPRPAAISHTGFLRASGGVSNSAHRSFMYRRFSPRKRRCFPGRHRRRRNVNVFSAQAEVFLPFSVALKVPRGFLRASGGVSQKIGAVSIGSSFSPRKRRCFIRYGVEEVEDHVFSAQAEVFPSKTCSARSTSGFLRASGGVSRVERVTKPLKEFSPRKRRCFYVDDAPAGLHVVFSAQADVFLSYISASGRTMCFLRASGGVSHLLQVRLMERQSSPRKRRCFSPRVTGRELEHVFSAQAEVFPKGKYLQNVGTRFLRASGGVSLLRGGASVVTTFSPRKRRCFSFRLFSRRLPGVFSAQAEVFLPDLVF